MCTDILIYVQNICVCIYKHICAYSYTYVYLCVYKTKPNKKKTQRMVQKEFIPYLEENDNFS